MVPFRTTAVIPLSPYLQIHSHHSFIPFIPSCFYRNPNHHNIPSKTSRPSPAASVDASAIRYILAGVFESVQLSLGRQWHRTYILRFAEGSYSL